ncbi:hypothetical protein JCM1840_005026 [Sporobolomyces johnsonii]
MASAARPPIIAGDSCVSPFSPLSPAAGVGDGWDTPASAKNPPLPSQAHLLPDRQSSPARNHHRSTSPHLKLSSMGAAPPPPRPKPKLATPSHGYPFPWVLSRTSTPQPAVPSSLARSNASTPPAEQPRLSSAFSSDGSSASSSTCSTPNDDQPLPASSKPSTPAIHHHSDTPFEIAHARTKNAGSTPGAPPPAQFVEDGAGQPRASQDFRDVQRMSSCDEPDADEGIRQATSTKEPNPLVDGLRGLTVEGPKGAGRKEEVD